MIGKILILSATLNLMTYEVSNKLIVIFEKETARFKSGLSRFFVVCEMKTVEGKVKAYWNFNTLWQSIG